MKNSYEASLKSDKDSLAPNEKLIASIPIYFFFIISCIVLATCYFKLLPHTMIGALSIIMPMGIALSFLGRVCPVAKDIGGPAIFCLMVPSLMVWANVFDPEIVGTVKSFMKDSNFLYLVIASLVVGSILGMSRQTLIQGIMRMFIPLAVGNISAIAVGLIVGKLCGYTFYHTYFYIIVPIMGGGIGEGVIPLSLSYSSILGGGPEQYIAQLVPAAVTGNIIAVCAAGFIAKIGNKFPHFTGNGELVKGKQDDLAPKIAATSLVNYESMGAGLLMICAFFLLGTLIGEVIGVPGIVVMIMVTVLCKYFNVIPAVMVDGAKSFHSFIAKSLIWPVMIGLGMVYIPLSGVISQFSVGFFLVSFSVVATITASSFFLAPWLNMHRVEASIVTTCNSGLGGTGDVAILSAADRMMLLPFAQIVTRIGGVVTVIIASFILRAIS